MTHLSSIENVLKGIEGKLNSTDQCYDVKFKVEKRAQILQIADLFWKFQQLHEDDNLLTGLSLEIDSNVIIKVLIGNLACEWKNRLTNNYLFAKEGFHEYEPNRIYFFTKEGTYSTTLSEFSLVEDNLENNRRNKEISKLRIIKGYLDETSNDVCSDRPQLGIVRGRTLNSR